MQVQSTLQEKSQTLLHYSEKTETNNEISFLKPIYFFKQVIKANKQHIQKDNVSAFKCV